MLSAERSLTDVLQDILKSLQDIVRAEVRLAKVEIKQDASDLAYSSAWLAGGAVLGLFAFGLALWGGIYALALVIPVWGASLTAALVLAVAAWLAIRAGLRKAKQVRPVPERTIETMKENLQWPKPSRK